MPLPSVTFRSELDPIVRKELDQFDGEITEYLLREHDDDGRHTKVTADALVVDGPVTITGGPVTIDGVPITGAAKPPSPHHATHEPGGSDPIVALSGAVITTGTVADARLSANVALKNINNNFSASQVITGNLGVSGNASANAGYYERLRSVAMGEWQAVPYSAANFGAVSPMTWSVPSGNIFTNTFTIIGKTLLWHFYLSSSTIGGSPAASLLIKPPVPPAYKHMPARPVALINGTPQEFEITIYDPTTLSIGRYDGTNVPVGTLVLHFQMFIEIA